MELMRHSDRKLTDKLYTDPDLHSTAQVLCNLHEDENLIKILTNISGKTGHKICQYSFFKKRPEKPLETGILKGKTAQKGL